MTLEWTDSVERFEKAVYLVQAGKAPALVLTGGTLPWVGETYTEGDAMRSAASNLGLEPSAIHVVRGVAVTADEARAIAALARELGWKRLILVTSAFHMPRAAFLFRRAGVSVIPFPVDYRTVDRRPLRLADFVPQGDGLWHTEIALKEFYGLLYYWLIRGD